MSFWTADNKIPIKQTKSSIASTNGLEYGPGQLIHIDIPSHSAKFIDPKNSYLQADFKIQLPAGVDPTRLQLDGQMGGQVLIRDLRIYSSVENGAVLLEEIQNYNSMCSVIYDYNKDDSLINKRAVAGEGTTTYKPQHRGTQGTPKSVMTDISTNPYFKGAVAGNQSTAFANTDFTTAKLMLPLHSGIFSSDKVYPNLLTGLRIEILLEDADVCLRQLESALHYNRISLNPVFDSVNGSTSASKTNWISGSATDTFYIKRDNSQYKPELSPFVVGERISFAPDGSESAQFNNASGNPAQPKILSINASSGASGGEGLVEIVLDQAYTLNSASTVEGGSWYVVSQSVDEATSFSPTYTLSNVEMIVGELDMGANYENSMMRKMKEGGQMALDILSVTNYKYSQQANDVVANIRLNLEQSRGRAIWCLPTDQTNYTSKQRISASGTYDIQGANDGMGTSKSTRSGLVGISDSISSYQFYYDGKLNPSRAVSTAKISAKNSIDAQVLIENEKSLVQANVPARSFSEFNNNFFISRALGLNQQVYDTRNKDFNIQVNYSGTPTKNKLWMNFVWHLRRINIRGDNISVIV
jgi:hypothetical protein